MHSDTTLHDPEAVFQKMMEVGRICSAGQKIDMIALSGTWHSVGLFQQDFTPVTPIYLWSNTEASKSAENIVRIRHSQSDIMR